jgi:hypothetical protein
VGKGGIGILASISFQAAVMFLVAALSGASSFRHRPGTRPQKAQAAESSSVANPAKKHSSNRKTKK